MVLRRSLARLAGAGAAQRTLDAAARNAMLNNAVSVASRDARTAPHASELRAAIEAGAAKAEARGAGLVAAAGDSRAVAHLQQAAFVLAAFRAVHAHVRDAGEARAMVAGMLNAHEGVQSVLIRGISLAVHPYGLASDSLTNLARDHGAGFESEVAGGEAQGEGGAGAPDRTELVVRQCFYRDFFEAEGAPELTKVFCALEAAPFEAFARDGRVAFDAPKTLTEGDEQCSLRVSKVHGARHPLLAWGAK